MKNVLTPAKAMTERLAFLQVNQETADTLALYKKDLEEALPEILEEFYAHILKWPNLAGMFKDETRIAHARQAQYDHWVRLFSVRFDEEYVQSVFRIGLIHSKIGLEPTWYIGAYAFTLSRLYHRIAHKYHSYLSKEAAQEQTSKLMGAVNQCAMIDMDLAISVYLDENKRTYDKKLNDMVQRLEDQVGTIVRNVSQTSGELDDSAANLATLASQTSMSVSTVASSSEETSTNITTVSAATEEMSVSIAHVADVAGQSFRASSNAVAEAERSEKLITELTQTIDKISEVTELITRIAEQTNLLALNATIEAARAGEAGKGFAVVASEVKSLAGETARATEDIKAKVQKILNDSAIAEKSIGSVRQAIEQVNNFSKDTAEAADQQKQAVIEIARSIEQTSIGTREISKSVSDISKVAAETGQAAEQLLEVVKSLSDQGVQLEESVKTFAIELRGGDPSKPEDQNQDKAA